MRKKQKQLWIQGIRSLLDIFQNQRFLFQTHLYWMMQKPFRTTGKPLDKSFTMHIQHLEKKRRHNL